MSYINNNLDILNLPCSSWEKILLKNYDKKIASFANLIKTNDLCFNSVNKTITCCKNTLNLSTLDLNPNGLKKNKYSKEIIIKIKYLAECIANLLVTKHNNILKSRNYVQKQLQGKENKPPQSYLNVLEPESVSKKRPREDFEIETMKQRIYKESISELSEMLINACSNGDLNQCKKLIAEGAKINGKNSLGKTPLITAIKYVHFPIYEYLINHPNIDVNLSDNEGNTPLIHAVQYNNLRMCKELIQYGANVNVQNNKKITAIQHAALLTIRLNITDLVIPEAFAEGYNPLNYIFKINFEIFKLLIANGADIKAVNDTGRTVLDNIKERRPFNYRDKAHYIKNKSPSLSHQHKTFESKLRLAHVWNIGGIAKIRTSEKSYSFKLEGSFCTFWLHKMSKNLSLFCKKYPQLINKRLFKETLINLATSPLENTPKKQFERIKQGLPTFVKCTIKEHDILFFFWGDKLIIGNCGLASNAPIEAFHYDLEALTVEHLKILNNLKGKSEDEYKEFIFIHFSNQLNLIKNSFDLYLEKLGSKNLCMQTVDNCSWTSSMAVIFAFFLFSEIKKNKKLSLEEISKTHKLLLKKQVKIYHIWEKFQRIYSLERFLKFMDTANNSDLEIIDKIKNIVKKSNNPQLIKQTTDLLEANHIEKEEIELITSKLNSLSFHDEPIQQNEFLINY
jgi:ankyrin repeat protein